jgi:acyl carrier protein
MRLTRLGFRSSWFRRRQARVSGTPGRRHRTGEKGSKITEEIRRVLGEHARLVVDVVHLSDDDDLFRLGMTSHASVSVMLALEDSFGVEFPEHMLRKSTFESLGSIRKALTELLETPPAD